MSTNDRPPGRLGLVRPPDDWRPPGSGPDRPKGPPLPPHNIEAEMGVIGSILTDPDIADIHEITKFLRPEDFYRAIHQTIYRAIYDLYARGKPIDCVLLADELTTMGEYEAIGGDDTLAAIMGAVPHAVNGLHYALIVIQKSKTRQGIEAAQLIVEAGYSQSMTAEDLIELAQREVYHLSDDANGDQTATLDTVINETIANIDARAERRIGIYTGIPRLDEMTGGMQPGSVWVLAARPGVGKTALGINIVNHCAIDDGVPCGFVSLEMGRLQLGERILAARSGVPAYRLRDRDLLTPADLSAIADVSRLVADVPVMFIDEQKMTAQQVAAQARRWHTQTGMQLLVIDYLGLMQKPIGEKMNRWEYVSYNMEAVRRVADDLKIAVLLLQQLNRDADKRGGDRPRLSDLRDSGAIEQDAQTVLLLHRPEKHDPGDRPGFAELIVAKNRTGEEGIVKLRFNGPLTRFEPWIDIPPAIIPAERDRAY